LHYRPGNLSRQGSQGACVDKTLGTLGVLLEPTTVVAKAWEHIGGIGRRTFRDPQTVLVVGAGPIGLLAALIGVQRGADTHVLDRATSGPKPALVKQLGASYHTGPIADLELHPTSWWSAPA
jgi:threonine dehydrogenase-like Zn-dependent dehydrogenase